MPTTTAQLTTPTTTHQDVATNALRHVRDALEAAASRTVAYEQTAARVARYVARLRCELPYEVYRPLAEAVSLMIQTGRDRLRTRGYRPAPRSVDGGGL